jgi:hypothetical protein
MMDAEFQALNVHVRSLTTELRPRASARISRARGSDVSDENEHVESDRYTFRSCLLHTSLMSGKHFVDEQRHV